MTLIYALELSNASRCRHSWHQYRLPTSACIWVLRLTCSSAIQSVIILPALGRQAWYCGINPVIEHAQEAQGVWSNATAGWRFYGSLVEGKTQPCGEWDTGEMWECPFFVELPSSAGNHLVIPAVLTSDSAH